VIPLLPPAATFARLDHLRIRIETRELPTKARSQWQAAGSQPMSSKGIRRRSCHLLRDFLEKLWRIRLPVAGIEFNR